MQNVPQSRCACIQVSLSFPSSCPQITFTGNPQYQCACGDVNGNPVYTTSTTGAAGTQPPVTTQPTPAPTTTTTTQAPTTTTVATTTTPAPTTQPQTTQPPVTLPGQTTTILPQNPTYPYYGTSLRDPHSSPSGNSGNCQCVMIQISSPSSAQYQCSCGDQGTYQYPTQVCPLSSLSFSSRVPTRRFPVARWLQP